MIHKHAKTMFIGFIVTLVLLLSKCTGTTFSNCVPDYTSVYWQDLTFFPEIEDNNGIFKCSFNVPVKAQNNWLNGNACLPTSVSMVLDYYHQYDTDLQTATISQFISTLNPGDITAENGIYIHKIIDHLKALGYQHTFYMMKPTMTLNRLKVFMIDGPVIVQLGVKLGYQPRRILGVGDYQHATVLLGMSIDEQTVLVNDPWSGSQLELPMVEFLDMWDRSNNIALMIRP